MRCLGHGRVSNVGVGVATGAEEAVDEGPLPAAEHPALDGPGQSGAMGGRAEADPADHQLSVVGEDEAMAAFREEFHRQETEDPPDWLL